MRMLARFVLAAMTVAVAGRKAKGESKMDEMTEKQEIVYNLRGAFNAAIEIANELNIDGKALEQAKQDIIWQIIEAWTASCGRSQSWVRSARRNCLASRQCLKSGFRQ